MDVAVLESFHNIDHRAEQRLKPHTETTAELTANISSVDGTNELAGRIHWQDCDVCVKTPPAVVLKKILLNVRQIECSYRRIVVLQILPHRPKRFRPAKVTDERNDEVLHLHIANHAVVLFSTQKTPVHTLPIVHGHQIHVCRRQTTAKSTAPNLIIEIRPGFGENAVHIFDVRNVLLVEPEFVL